MTKKKNRKQSMTTSADGQENHLINYLSPQKKTNKSDCHNSEQPFGVWHFIICFIVVVSSSWVC